MPTVDRPARREPSWRLGMRIARTIFGAVAALLLIVGIVTQLDSEVPAPPEPVAPLPPYSSPITPSAPIDPPVQPSLLHRS